MAFDVVAPGPQRARRRWPGPSILVAVGLAVVVAVSIVAYAARRGHPQPADTSIDASRVFSIQGSLRLRDVESGWTAGTPCAGLSTGKADIKEGADITIRVRNGDSVAIAHLGPGITEVDLADGHPVTVCTFSIQVANVPAGLGMYGIEVARRGMGLFAEAELRQRVILKVG